MDIKKFSEDLKNLGVEKGMDLMVHSSLRNVGANAKDAGADMVIDALLEIIGPDGTLLAPAVSGSVKPDQPVFHVEYTPSTVGFFTNALRSRPEAVRSLHPVHSVAAAGPKAEFFLAGHIEANTPWSPETPYGRLVRDKDAAILFLGVNLNYNSCFHALEIEARLPGMHTPESTILHVIDKKNSMFEVEHHWHHPLTRRFFPDMEYVLHESGCLNWGKTERGMSRLVQAVPMREVILKLLAEEPWLMTRPPADNAFIWEP